MKRGLSVEFSRELKRDIKDKKLKGARAESARWGSKIYVGYMQPYDGCMSVLCRIYVGYVSDNDKYFLL